jgi:hypothetical protein
MIVNRLAASAALAAAITLATVALPTTAGAASPPSLPQTASADAAASWLAGQFVSGEYIPSPATPTPPYTPDLSATANAVLALASAGVDTSLANSALVYLEGQVDTYVTADGSDGPAELSLLILDAKALGVSPKSFGGTNLVARLLATQQTTGAEAGLFGTPSQAANYDAGNYEQGLALAALAAAGVTGTPAVVSAVSWLTGQQCLDGGWTSLNTTSNPCDGKPARYEGPDTNSSALAVEGLEAQGSLGTTAATSALHFFKRAEDADGGWGYEPNTSATPGSTDPDSTALVIQALLALGYPPSSSSFTKSGTDPVASLLSDQIASGPGAGALVFPGISGPNLLATYQAIPALAGVTFAYNIGTPVLTKVGPLRGPAAGGTVVHLTGSSLTEVSNVLFGTTSATSFTVRSGISITAVAPPGVSGTVAVTVVSPAGTSAVTATTHFTYS